MKRLVGSRLDKLKERILNKPKDFTYCEAKKLLGQIRFVEYNKGKTSGSRVKFYRKSDDKTILLHKPHPKDEMDRGVVESLVTFLKEIGDL